MSRVTRYAPIVLALLVLAGLTAPAVRADVKPVKPVQEWQGKFLKKEEEPLMKETPASGYLANQKAWARLWKAWRGKEELPKIDFSKQLVLVGAAPCAANRIGANFTVDDKGDLRGGFFATEIGGPGFVYLIVVVDRNGIKTWNGKPIPSE
jgi:hypothetical protein